MSDDPGCGHFSLPTREKTFLGIRKCSQRLLKRQEHSLSNLPHLDPLGTNDHTF